MLYLPVTVVTTVDVDLHGSDPDCVSLTQREGACSPIGVSALSGDLVLEMGAAGVPRLRKYFLVRPVAAVTVLSVSEGRSSLENTYRSACDLAYCRVF